jgi:cob(I)alamin adenosyltransferase
MSIHEKLRQDEEDDKKAIKAKIAEYDTELFQLKEKLALFEDGSFIWFFKKFIQNPLKEAENMLINEIETNKTFVLKGKVQAYRSLFEARAVLNKSLEEIRNEKDALMKALHNETPSHLPEN